MKKVFFVLAAVVPLLVSAKPVFSFIGGKADCKLSGIKINGKWYKKNVTSVLDGQNALVTDSAIPGAQTIIVTAEYKNTPTGVIFSRHRAEKKYHGFELGFCDRSPYHFNGRKLGFHISDAGKENSLAVVFPDAPQIEAEKSYSFIMRFEPERVDIFVIDCKAGKLIYSKGISADGIKSVDPGAGNGVLLFGARRANSKTLQFPAPAGTEFKRMTIYDRAVNDRELSTLLGVKIENTLT